MVLQKGKGLPNRRPFLAVKNELKQCVKLIYDAGRSESEAIYVKVDYSLVMAELSWSLNGFRVIWVILFLGRSQSFCFFIDAISDGRVKFSRTRCLRKDTRGKQKHCCMKDIVMDWKQLFILGKFNFFLLLRSSTSFANLIAIHLMSYLDYNK